MTRTFWEELVGSKVCGGYLLRELISSDEGSVVYRTSYGEEGAALKLIPADETAPEVPQVDHPNIVGLYASGACDLDGSKFHYFVMEAVDENLASVIAARALSPDETREMLGPVLDALAFLHEQGLAHGRIEPSNILAKGDSIKLSPDSVRPAGTEASPEEDMRALGLTIIEVLTGQRQPSGIAELPQPFRDMVEHMLQLNPPSRWTARQAAMRLAGKVPAAAPAPVPETASRAVAPVVPAGKKPMPRWVYPAGAAVAIGLLIILVRVAGSSSEPSIAASISTGTTSSNVPTPSAPSPPGAPPVVEKGVEKGIPKDISKGARKSPFAPPTVTPPADHPPATGPAGHGWFVVVASYAREADAKQEARDLGRRFPQFKLGVFPPSPIDAHYVVIIGSGLSEEGAESLRQRAVATGLPHDTYIKKFPSSR